MADRPICGFVAVCGRNPGHPGQHGGFRSNVRGVVRDPYPHVADVRLGSALRPVELRTLVEYIAHGSAGAAARCLGRTEQTVKNNLALVRQRTGARTTLEALIALGWLEVPDSVGAIHG